MKIKLTPALKAHAVKHLGVKKEATDADFTKAVGLALIKGTMTADQLGKLTGGAPKPPVKKGADGRVPPTNKRDITPRKPAPGISPAAVQKMIAQGIEAHQKKVQAQSQGTTSVTPGGMYNKSVQVRLKGVAERYDNTHKVASYPTKSGYKGDGRPHKYAGMDAKIGGRKLYHPSDLDNAISGAYLKFCIEASVRGDKGQIPQRYRMTEHDNQLLKYALHEREWTGLLGGDDSDTGANTVHRQKLTEFQIKALLDDSVSGGIEAAPISFDDAIILLPVLYGELFPYVNVVNVTRGRRMKGAAMALPSFTSGIAEGTSITPFNTASFVTAFDTAIFPAVSAFEIGLDFEEDSPVDLGSSVTEQYGLKALEWLDRVIAYGDGVTEPEGVFQATGTTTVTSDNGVGGPATVSDYEGLMFGVEKRFRNEPGAVCMYLANDTMYRRSRAIPVGPGDERRVFGMTHGDYMLLDHDYKIQNDIPNGRVAFFNAKRYRMYRRLGLNVRVETTGRSLALTNTKLLVLRMRYGGRLETGGAAAIMTDAQS